MNRSAPNWHCSVEMDEIIIRIIPSLNHPIIITPSKFAENMKAIMQSHGCEDAHKKADDLLCKVLRCLGYHEGVETFENTIKWYA